MWAYDYESAAKEAGEDYVRDIGQTNAKYAKRGTITLCVGAAYILWRGFNTNITFNDLLAFFLFMDATIWSAMSYNRAMKISAMELLNNKQIAAIKYKGE
jgi:hypothetical protein